MTTPAVQPDPPVILTCPCCGWSYTKGTGEWWSHDCAGRGRGTSHLWHQAYCHLAVPGATPREGACGKCPKHCTCASRNKNNLPKMEPNEGIQQFIQRMRTSTARTSREWSPHNSE